MYLVICFAERLSGKNSMYDYAYKVRFKLNKYRIKPAVIFCGGLYKLESKKRLQLGSLPLFG